METFEFKSAICTSVEQSKRLLELGLKKETADMVHQAIGATPFNVWYKNEIEDNFYPAWSLHRLIEILYNGTSESIKHLMKLGYKDMNYNTIITCIEDLIKLNQFNKDYLEEKV